MFRNVLVGVDGAEGGADAIALARVLAGEGGEVTFGHVIHDGPHGPRGWPEPSAPTAREHAAEVLERARSASGIDAHVRWCGASSVGRGLHELAETVGADLLVVGSSRRALLGRTRLADDTRAALNGAPCAVAIAPTGYSIGPPALMREVGVGYDGSPESEQALSVARSLADEFGSRLSAFHALAIPAFVHLGEPAHIRETISDLVRDSRERIGELGDLEPHAAYGDPVEELTLYSASLDLLVIGSRGYGPLGRLLYGSTAQALARSARCPLLVLTRAVLEARTGLPRAAAASRSRR